MFDWQSLRNSRLFRLSVAFFLIVLLASALLQLRQPRLDREWRPDQAHQATISFDGDFVTISHVRDARYRTTEDYDIAWAPRTYNMSELRGVDFVVEPLSETKSGVAHTLYSFDFSGEHLVLSVEARKTVGEKYGFVRGIMRTMELGYIFATEEDIIGLRAVQRNHSVYVYPINTTPERAQALFRDVALRANELAVSPEFYNTVTRTCTTEVVDRVNSVVPGRVPRWSYRVLMPGYSDELAYEIGLIDTDLPLDQIRERYDVSAKVRSYSADKGDFSAWIRS